LSDHQDNAGAQWPAVEAVEAAETDVEDHLEPGLAGDVDGLFPAPVSGAPRTGDEAVDAALADLEQGARDDDLDAQVAAGERAHLALQARLDDLGTA